MGSPEDLTAVGVGGPGDGTELGRAGPEAYEIVMADRTRHRYVRTDETRGVAVGYRWAGRV